MPITISYTLLRPWQQYMNWPMTSEKPKLEDDNTEDGTYKQHEPSLICSWWCFHCPFRSIKTVPYLRWLLQRYVIRFVFTECES